MVLHSTAYEEPSEVVARNLWTGVRLFIGADAFFFAGFVFAFFYLRALNSAGMFRDPHDHQSTGLGVAILVVSMAAVGLLYWGVIRVRAGDAGGWRTAGGLALVATVAVVVLQIVQYSQFGLDRHAYQGYGSLFLGWTTAYLVHMLGAGVWLETLVAQSLRDRTGTADLVARAEACLAFFEFMAVMGAVMFVLLYLV